MDRKVVVFICTSSGARLPLYRRLRSLGLTLVLVHPCTPSPVFDGIFQYWLQHDTDDVEGVYLALSAFLASHKLVPDAVVSFDEYGVHQAVVLADRLNLTPVPMPDAAFLQNNLKHSFRGFCSGHGISSPKSAPLPVEMLLPTLGEMSNLARDADALSMAFEKTQPALTKAVSMTMEASALTFPVVLKPSPGAGSLLVRLCTTLDEAVAFVWHMWTTLANHPDTKHFAALTNRKLAGAVHKGVTSPVQILVEDFIEGQEVDLDCIIEHGVVRFRSISDNFAPSLPYFAEVGGLCPSSLGYRAQCAMRDLLDSYVRAHGARLHGVIHFEAKYDPARQRAYVIEVNCRPGSAETSAMLQTVYRGLNLGEALVRCALQMPIEEQLASLFPELLASQQEKSAAQTPWQKVTPPCLSEAELDAHIPSTTVCSAMWSLLGGPSLGFFPPQCWAASTNMYPTQAGVLVKARAPVEDASLVSFSISAKVGQIVTPPPKQFYMLCWMVAKGATAEQAKDNILRVTNAFDQEVSAV
ncbi:hypothetical protein LPMP_342120 [Leishmania panamensis]|uniref:ATP-grasp domain-containing protein n=1 Tax=Leishmania panamensis TaxID=5679 RepID=A0A088S0B1_LEIPA|nr:hypothetical protein LPMP_342120 [Leishmania panamensis]AIO01838.1 hypothetical protein LPMP_342120 [Leishmania panamensis]